ncbi:hypothetical protein [Pseudomonas silesiensis]
MPDKPPPPKEQPPIQLSTWEDKGAEQSLDAEAFTTPPELTNAELVHLRVRVIALENLVIALLTHSSDRQLAIAREMAAYISPRPGFTQHPLTIHAAAQMNDSVDRAERFRKRDAP